MDDIINKSRIDIAILLHKIKSHKNKEEKDFFYRKICLHLKRAQFFLKSNPQAILIRADKGSAAVLMSRSEYEEKMAAIINDDKTYKILQKDPINSIISNNNRLAIRLFRDGHISESDYTFIRNHNGNHGKTYGLVKIHKPGNKLRNLVTTCGTPSYNFSKFISKLLKPLTENSPYNVKNSFELVPKLKSISFEPDEPFEIYSLDVESLFTNTPVEVAIDYISENYEQLNLDIPKQHLIETISFILNSVIFSYNGTLYQQIFGVPMGSPLSMAISNIALFQIEKKVISSLNTNLKCYIRYADDTLLITPPSDVDKIHKKFNSMHPRVKFTIERSIDNKINFLDTTTTFKNNKITTNWFQKQTATFRYINFLSFAPMKYKRSIVFHLVDRAFHLSETEQLDQNLILIREKLLQNSYPLILINKLINQRLN